MTTTSAPGQLGIFQSWAQEINRSARNPLGFVSELLERGPIAYVGGVVVPELQRVARIIGSQPNYTAWMPFGIAIDGRGLLEFQALDRVMDWNAAFACQYGVSFLHAQIAVQLEDTMTPGFVDYIERAGTCRAYLGSPRTMEPHASGWPSMIARTVSPALLAGWRVVLDAEGDRWSPHAEAVVQYCDQVGVGVDFEPAFASRGKWAQRPDSKGCMLLGTARQLVADDFGASWNAERRPAGGYRVLVGHPDEVVVAELVRYLAMGWDVDVPNSTDEVKLAELGRAEQTMLRGRQE
ncbi:MAG: hypothetical protein SFZ23_08640 [Planctomycetota bacterium]|nr:hypothetical protein [Planctomycetota bacterium]